MSRHQEPSARIAISVGVYLEGARGIPLFQSHLARELAAIDARNEYLLFSYFYRDFERKRRLIPVPNRPNFRLDLHRWPQALVDPLIYHLDLPLLWPPLWLSGVRLFHSTSLYTPPLAGIKTITTVCDLIPECFPEWGVGHDPRRVRRWLQRANQLVALSYHTRKDLKEIYGIPEERVDVVHLGVDTARFHPPAPGNGSAAQILRKYRLPERYLFTIGPVEPRRNLETVLKSLAAIRSEPEAQGLGLVVAGSGEKLPLLQLARSLGLEDALYLPGYVPIEDLVVLHQNALAFVYPSLYEGFGLSPLEAMACGVPVISSNSSSLPEVLGDAAALVDPKDAAGFAREILDVLREPGLRRQRAEAGLKRAATLTWRRTAERYLSLYEKTLYAG